MVTLYHGTSSRYLHDILQHGIRPRGEALSNWEECPSGSDLIYLTNAYATHYAGAARKEDEPMLILEVKVDFDDLLPDEDFVAQAQNLHGADGGLSLIEMTANALENLDRYRDWAQDSLSCLGNAAFRGTIPPERINRYALMEGAHWNFIFDPTITVANYYFLGAYYRNAMRWIFDPECDFEDDPPLYRSPTIRDLDRNQIEVFHKP